MLEFLSMLVTLVVLGLIVGVEILLYRENQRVRDFIAKRPVLASIAMVVGGGLAAYAILYVLMIAAIAILGVLLH